MDDFKCTLEAEDIIKYISEKYGDLSPEQYKVICQEVIDYLTMVKDGA